MSDKDDLARAVKLLERWIETTKLPPHECLNNPLLPIDQCPICEQNFWVYEIKKDSEKLINEVKRCSK